MQQDSFQKIQQKENKNSPKRKKNDCATKTIHQLFEEQVKKTPDNIAVCFEDQQLTYVELNRKANQLAHYLIKRGVKVETPVAICLNRGLEMIIAILGILKAGGAYVPIDLNYPDTHIQQIVKNCSVSIILTQIFWKKKIENSFITNENQHFIALDQDWPIIQKERADNLPCLMTHENLIYIMHTSGSEGEAKDVMVTHQNVVNYIIWFIKEFHIHDSDKIDFSSSIIFDFSVTCSLLPLSCGASIIICDEKIKTNPREYLNYLKTKRITYIKVTPSYLKTLLPFSRQIKELVHLKWIILGGEAIYKKDVSTWLVLCPNHKLVNEYGPTETTVATVGYIITKDNIDDYEDVIPIGKPALNTQAYVLDGLRRLVSIGEKGILYIGGTSVSRGYLNQPKLTAQKFITNPFGNNIEDRLYETGDVVRLLPDGNLEFIGRMDNQVKIRGFRVEITEVETILNRLSIVLQSIVVAKKDIDGNNYIAAYLVARHKSKGNINFIRKKLKVHLPNYMIPSVFILMDKLPLTLNGKVDRKALIERKDYDFMRFQSQVSPRNKRESTLVRLWAEILNLPADRIGIDDNFFELGGHSLLVLKLHSSINRTFSVDLSLDDLFTHLTVRLLASLLKKVRKVCRKFHDIQPIKKTKNIPLSFAQEQIWLHQKLEENLPIFNEPLTITMSEAINYLALEKAINAIIKRHKILYTRFLEKNGTMKQHIHPFQAFKLPFKNLQHIPKKQRLREALKLGNQQVRKLFNLSQEPPIRFLLVQLSKKQFKLFVTSHHLVNDTIAISNIFVNELAVLYKKYEEGKKSDPLPKIPLQYHDFAVWEQKQGKMNDQGYEKDLIYWRDCLRDLPSLRLPTVRDKPLYPSFLGKQICFRYSKELTVELKRLSQDVSVTYFSMLLTALNILLYHYTGQIDISIGSVFSNRMPSGTDHLIGIFLNTIIFRNNLSNNPSFIQQLRETYAKTLETYIHSFLPFQKILQTIQWGVRTIYERPAQVTLILEPSEPIPRPSWKASQLEVHPGTTKTSLMFELDEDDKGMFGRVEYNTDLFNEAFVQQMINHYEVLLQDIVDSPEKSITQLEILTEKEKRTLLTKWSQSKKTRLKNKLLHQLFEKQVKKTPKDIAVCFGEDRLTYHELNERANKLANFLIKKGIKPNILIAICLERSLETIVGILGILKAGGAYVPLDPKLPISRLQFMLEDTKAPILITQSHLRCKFSDYKRQMIYIDQDWPVIDLEKKNNPGIASQSENLAYVIYTSGSTGQPKGVMIAHDSICHRLNHLRHVYGITSQDHYLHYCSFGFDASLEEIFLPILSGAKLIIAPLNMECDIYAFIDMVEKQAITTINFVPILLQVFLETLKQEDTQKCRTLRCVIAGADVLNRNTVELFFKLLPARLFNTYGPTENTIDSTLFECTPDMFDTYYTVPIGKPIADSTAYVLDQNLNLTPTFVHGELYVGGIGLAKGYLNQPVLTKEKFIQNPFAHHPNDLLYKTGDSVRWLPDGSLEFLGRIDSQVKIRGFRIEMEEIETHLNQYTDVLQAAVIDKGGNNGNKYLVAYITPKETFDLKALRNYLKTYLPHYMIPAIFVLLDELPLTSSGKINYELLRNREDSDSLTIEEYRMPTTSEEKILAEIWADVLRVSIEKIGVCDNFFDLGGHSILAILMLSKVNKRFLIDIPLCQLLRAPTIEELSVLIDKYKTGN